MQSPIRTPESEEEARPQATALEAGVERMVELAQRAPSFAAFYCDALPVFAECVGATYVEVEVRRAGTVIHEQCSHGSVDPAFWASIVQESMVDALAEPGTRVRVFEGREVDLSIAVLTTHVGNEGRRGGVIAFVVPFVDASGLRAAMDQADVLCSLSSALVASIGERARSDQNERAQDQAGRIQRVAAFSSEIELAYAITNKLRSRDGAVQVALASVSGTRLELLSVSGIDDIAPRSPGIKNLRSAMQECVDLAQPVVSQDEPLEQAGVCTGGRLHRAWRADLGDANVASIPLVSEGRIVAVLSLQRAHRAPFGPEDLDELREQVEPYAAGLEMVRVARRPLLKHLRDSSVGLVGSFLAPGAWGRRLALLGVAALSLWAVYGRLPYSIEAPAELLPMAGRHVASAADGVLVRVHVRPGDEVQAGELLAEFETRELELEAARLEAELEASDVDVYRQLGAGAAGDAELARAHAAALRASLDLVRHRIECARVLAPAAGVILEGDHRERLGDAFAKGETLFRMAEGDQWRLALRVPERDIDLVQLHGIGSFVTHARPGVEYGFSTTHIAPTAEVVDGLNVFVVEARCDPPAQWIRAGMEGFASLEGRERSPLWIAGHRLVDFLRLHLWL